MKCTLRKTEQGVVATIEKIPRCGEYSIFRDNIIKRKEFQRDESFFNHKTIIASTFGVGKELKVNINGIAFNLPPLSEDEFIEYDYTETETQIIIQL